jgi:hypothetical protein
LWRGKGVEVFGGVLKVGYKRKKGRGEEMEMERKKCSGCLDVMQRDIGVM